MSNRRAWSLIVGLAGAGSLLTALASSLTDLPVASMPLVVIGGVLTAIGGALTISTISTISTKPVDQAIPPTATPQDRQPSVVGAVPRLARWFQPRPIEQEALAAALSGGPQEGLAVLLGGRGAGKSQLAAAYAWRCVADGFDLVVWINSEGGPVLELARFAVERGVARDDQPHTLAAAAGVAALSVLDGRRRLLVFDNVDDPDNLTPWLPASGTVEVIVTTIRQEFASMAGVIPIEVGMFTPDQTISYLNAATGLSDPDGARELGERLGWLPLGLAQGAAYLRLHHLTYRQYLIQLDSLPLDETLQRHAGSLHLGIIAATRLTLAAITSADPTGKATRLMTMLACLAAEGISRRLLTHLAVAHTLGLDLAAINHSLGLLANTSLISFADTTNPHHAEQDRAVIVVHRLIAAVIRHLTPSDDLAIALAMAVKVVETHADQLPQHQAALRRREFDELARHINILYRYHRDHPPADLLKLCNWVGDTIGQVGDHDLAITLLRRNLADRKRTLGADHLDTLISRDRLATAYWLAGRYQDAIENFEQNVADYERVLGPDDLVTGDSRNNLALAYKSAGRYHEAIALLERTLSDCERILGPSHLDTVDSRNNVALAYWQVGRHDEAMTLHQQTLADRERQLGPDHPDVLQSRDNLALAYHSAGRNDEPIALHRQTLADHERVQGQDHPETLRSRNNLGAAFHSAGRYHEAIAMHEQSVADHERILGAEHPQTLTSRSNLALAYQAANRIDEAIALLDSNLADRQRILGADHPDTIKSHKYLADARSLAADTT